jgi:hypothetical protein
VRDRRYPGGAVHVQAHQARSRLRRLTGMHTHPNPDLLPSRPRICLHGLLQLHHRLHTCLRRREHREKPITLGIDFLAAMSGQTRSDQRVVTGEYLRVDAFPHTPQQRRRALNVGEQKRESFGALASQLGAVTVSAVPDRESAEVGGLQNTVTNLGASLGTALVGAVLIASLTTGLANGVQDSSAIPANVKAQATTQLEAGVPFISDTDLEARLQKADIPPAQADAVLEANSDARLSALRTSLSVVALIAVVALFLTGLVPTEPVGRAKREVATPKAAEASTS